MASTDAKSGFRLPWSVDRNESDTPADTSGDETGTADPAGPQSESETPTMIDDAPTAAVETLQDEESTASPDAPAATGDDSAMTTDAPETTPDAADASADLPAATPAPAPVRKPNKFMADLTRAMQSAAEAARADTLERFSSEAKAHIERIHASTADQAVELRKKADDDIAAIREWSKTEIARIREETDERVAYRKETLEREIEAHAAGIEGRVEQVQARISSFEAEMASFFERLLVEDDPTRFAALAESLPEPPGFDLDAAGTTTATLLETATVADVPAPADVTDPAAEAVAEDAPAEATIAKPTPEEPAALEAEPADGGAEEGSDPSGTASNEWTSLGETDPRLSALGLEQDFTTAESEAASFPAESADPEDEIPTIAEDALAARLAGLVAEDHPASDENATTRVVVTGLASVASIAGFKRNLARVDGVRSVGVSSGPDGEFVFSVSHDPGLGLADAIATLPGFAARVTNEAPDQLIVAARDPESEA